jgi:PAS domain S-box-containing protein
MVSASTLLVTSDKALATELSEHLVKLGYRVIGIAATEAEAMARIEASRPDVILTDIRLEVDRVGEIRTGSLIQTTFELPIIYITGSIGQNTIQRARLTGPFGYLYRPFNDQQLLVTIETALTRHQLEQKLKESRQWLNTTLTSIGDGVIATDEQGLVRFINPVAMEFTGWQHIEAIGLPLRNVFYFVDEILHEPIDLLSMENPSSHPDRKKGYEGVLMSRNENPLLVEANITSIKDGKGNIYGMVLVFRDITQQRQAIEEIRRQANRTEALMQVASQLNSQLDLQSVLNTICEITNRSVRAAGTAVLMKDTDKEVFRLMAATSTELRLQNYRGSEFKISKEIFQAFLSRDNPVRELQNVQDFPNLPYFDVMKTANIQSLAVAALFHGDELVGALIAAFTRILKGVPEGELDLLKGLADQASSAIENAELFEQVRAGRERQRKLAKSLVDIQEAERRRIAKELHDHFGQLLTGLQFMLETAKSQVNDAQKLQLEEIQNSVSDVIRQVSEMSLNLRPSMLDDLGLLPTLRWHIDRYTSQTGITVNFQCDEFPKRIPLEIETAAYRIIQEALTNVARYAKVREVFVGIALQQDSMWLEILDKGKGFDSEVIIERPSTGLGGMRERANLVGGYLVVKSYVDQGTQIVATLPVSTRPIERRKNDRKHYLG